MEVDFTLWSLQDILKQIPFDTPVTENGIALDFSEINAPDYVKTNFKVIFIYDKTDKAPYDASCSIYSPKGTQKIGIVITINQKYEKALEKWLNTKDKNCIELCYRRRELYCHEVSHLIAIIRAFPSERFFYAKDDFIKRSKDKFAKSIKTAEEVKPVRIYTEEVKRISTTKPGISPSVFDKEHFRYGSDSLNYFNLYQELILPYDRMKNAVVSLCENIRKTGDITFDNVAKETLVSKDFFDIFPEKLTALRELLSKEIFGEIS
jgi:hypothetical protein